METRNQDNSKVERCKIFRNLWKKILKTNTNIEVDISEQTSGEDNGSDGSDLGEDNETYERETSFTKRKLQTVSRLLLYHLSKPRSLYF